MKPYHQGVWLLLLNLALGLGTFIQILDVSIANVAIPYIAGSLAVSPDEGTWVITSFAASNAIVLPLTGWLADYFGRVRLFVGSVILFAIMSLLCGLATSLAMLVFFRVLQGACAGSLIPLSQSLLMLNNPEESRGSALGFWGMIVIFAPVVGPVLGGYISEVYSWPWIFFINVPIGIISAALTWFLLKDRESPIVRNSIDWLGLILLVVGIGSLQILLDRGRDLDWFESNTIITMFVISLISLAYFGVWNFFQKNPIVDFSFFKDRNFVLGNIFMTIGFLFYFGSTVIVPLWLQTEQNYTPFWAGVAVAPIGFAPLMFSTLLGKNLHRFDLRKIVSLSFLFFGLGFLYQTTFTTQVSLGELMFARFLQGIGALLFFIPLVQLTLSNIPPEKFASATGVFTFIRILIGSGFGTALAIELWTYLETIHHSRLAESITPYRGAAAILYSEIKQLIPGISHEGLNRYVDRLVEQQSFMLATNDVIALAAFAFFLIIPIPFLCKRVNNSKPKQVASD
jgi:DHA2 family multidrug resistance protein